MNFFRISGFWAATKSCIEFLVGIMNLKKMFCRFFTSGRNLVVYLFEFY